MRFDEIDSIIGEAKFYFWRYVIKSKSGENILYITPSVQHGGELIERILQESEYITYVDLGKLPKEEKAWQKEPDWPLINRAITRAEENRRKSEDEAKTQASKS